MFDSGKTRRQIGIRKRQLISQCETIKQILHDHDLPEKGATFTPFSNEELIDLREELVEARDQLHETYTRVEQLHIEWSNAQKSHPEEQQAFLQYLEKYGDYTKRIQEAKSTLTSTDELLTCVSIEFHKRHLEIPLTNQSPTFSGNNRQSGRAHEASPLPSQPQRDPTSTMSFVDASLLSRLDLPTFDGNLLEYPEFFSRYSTLIGNKTELDDTTKFSLLKSCLRGKALHSIQGLALTARNYGIALDILKNRYDDKVTTRHILFSQLANLPPCDPEGKDLQSLYNKMFALTRQLCAYEDDAKETGLGAILINKLPRRIRSQIYDKTGNSHNLTPMELMHILTEIVHKEATLQEIDFHCWAVTNMREEGYASLQRPRSPKREHPQRKTQYFRNNSRPRTTTPTSTGRGKPKACSFCESNMHSSFDCTRYSSPERRSQIVRDRRLCFNCLSSQHRTRECQSKWTCRKCSKRHHTSLCLQQSASHQDSKEKLYPTTTISKPRQPRTLQVQFATDPIITKTSDTDTTDKNIAATTQSSSDTKSTSSQPAVLLMCTEVEVFNPSKSNAKVRSTVFLDSGSSKSYITTRLASILQLPVEKSEEISMLTFGSLNPLPFSATQHTIGIQTSKGPHILSVKALQFLTSDIKIATITEETENFINLPTISKKPDILIGADYFWDVLLYDNFHVKNLSNGYQLVHSSLGDMITGKPLRTMKSIDYCYSSSSSDDERLDDLLQRFWTLDTQGTLDNVVSTDDETCLKNFNETIQYDHAEGRYVVQLPFKGDKKDLPSNIQLAYARLVQNIKMLKHKPNLLEEYHRIIQNQLTRKIIEEVHENRLPCYCHYLAHHAVISESSTTTKVRCVYDGSAKTKNNPSLKDLLFRGPVLLPELSGVLLRTRLSPIVIASDIEKAFLMVGLDDESKDFTRFLWVRDPQQSLTEDNVVTYRFRRVPFGLISSPFLLAGTIRYHLSMTETKLAKELIRNTYVDNIFYGVDTIEQGKKFYIESKDLFLRAGMNLRQYVSNSTVLNDFFADEEKEVSKTSDTTKILGILWDIKEDNFIIRLPTLPNSDTTWTKRHVLKVVAKTYDPLGWCAPVLFTSKLFLQSLWKEKLGWDDVIPSHLIKRWNEITSSWSTSKIAIPRRIITGTAETSTFEIHVLTDASKDGYCPVAYLVETNTTRKASILMSKTRLSPLKAPLTIPRLELSAINLGSKLLKYIRTNMDIPIKESFLWSDSNVALMWIKNGSNLPVFIRNRALSIKGNAQEAVLRFVPGNNNPADIGSRGVTIQQLISFENWWRGPQFLTQSKEHWPRDISSEHNQISFLAKVSPTPHQAQEILLDPERFSNWMRLLRVVFHVLLFIVKRSNRAKQNFGGSVAALYEKAEIVLFRIAQNQCPPPLAVQKQLNLFICKRLNIWKSKGRVDNADLHTETIAPVYLPRESHVTSLYTLHTHLTNNHCGINQTLTELRLRVWIPKGRLTVKRVLNKLCYHCKRYNAKPYKLPEFPVHPIRRVRRPCYPFENTGMDYAGPMLCKTDNNPCTKYWILLLTCMNTRAIYVDLVLNMTANTLLHALRRFFATTACPKWILCDNSKTFKSIADLQTSLDTEGEPNPNIIDYCARRRIDFKFIPSFSPWQGGLYEKMVHLFKMSFKHALNNRLLRIEELQTIAKETEAIVNSRPLTYVSEENFIPPLRPVDFLRPWTVLSPPRLKESEWKPRTTTKDQLIDEWNDTNTALNRFWKRWSSEYLTALREQYRMNHPHPRCINSSTPRKNDIVLIQDKNLERGQWQIGQVVSSSNDYLRSADVRLPSRKIITRPINLLCKFEVGDVDEEDESSKETSLSPTPRDHGHPMMTRSKAHQYATDSLQLDEDQIYSN